MEMKKSTRYEMRDTRYENGSALILVVVLTSLLAIVGVMFVMVARVDRIATSAISENKELNSAVEAVIARISQELVLDVPGVAGQPDYYDYPDGENAWLASLEPHKDGTDYKWRQISDVTGFLADNNYDTDDVDVKPVGLNTLKYVREYPEIRVNSDGRFLDKNGNIANEGLSGDADGDGVADSKWIELDDITSNKGKPIYAAIRVIDNGGMLNVNTARQFNPNSAVKNEIDGSSQTQIDLFALSERSVSNTITDLDDMRRGSETWNLDNYIEDVVWRYYQPAEGTKYTPFDISDELELRNRYTLNREDIDSRIEVVWTSVFRGPDYLSVPVGSSSSSTLSSWEDEVYYEASDVNDVNTYSYRHIGTTYNMDRIINPYGGRMVNVNKDGAGFIYSAIKLALSTADPNFKDIDEIAAQTAVNLIDFRDNDSDVNVFDPPPPGGKTYYGFERPCVYISELTHRFKLNPSAVGPPFIFPDDYDMSYAIELHKPYLEDIYPEPNQWQLNIGGYGTVTINWSGTKRFHVIYFENTNVPLPVLFDSYTDPNLPLLPQEFTIGIGTRVFFGGALISLQRWVGSDLITIDAVRLPPSGGGWLTLSDDNPHSIQRDIQPHKCIRRLWDSNARDPNLGHANSYVDPNTRQIQAHPANADFTNIGEIGMVFRGNAYTDQLGVYPPPIIGFTADADEEREVRLDLADPNYHGLFQYLTVFDPSSDSINNDGDYKDGFENTDEIALDETPEFKIPGRININTAPWYVIAQLPWVTDKIAQAIVAYRDKAVIADQNNINYSDRYDATDIDGLREEEGFASIGELATVVNDSDEDEYSMNFYILGDEENDDLDGFPDLTPGGSLGDGIEDDFEERDVIFARISNLVTVRSDVFTAYILVRIGADGPQKRVMAILDRSNVYSDDGRVQIVALHPVADPR